MDAELFANMLSDKSILDLKKLRYRYPQADMKEFVALLGNGFYKKLPLKDFDGRNLVYLESIAQVHLTAVKVLLTPQNSKQLYGMKAMEEEILSTFTIEQIATTRDSVHKILSGYAPTTESENRIYGMKKGLEFIGVGNKVKHTGLPWQMLPEYMGNLVSFINEASTINDLLKAAIIHFYIGYLHPWFDGNGRMARLLHLWYLVQQRYSSALFVPLSEYVGKSRRGYYDAYTLAEQNTQISEILDVTPFLVYFIENVYHKLVTALPAPSITDAFQRALEQGNVTEKEQALWHFVLTAYGSSEFSTKQLEKAFGNAAYATIRGFVLKFEKLGLLRAARYGNRVKYRIEVREAE